MNEIGAQIDLSHPSDRVWQALTNPQLLTRWFTETEVVTEAPRRLLLHTAGLPGFHAAVDAEVTERRAPELLVLHCQEGDRRTRLTCAVTPTPEGCRLSVQETMEHGAWPAEDRDSRERYYQQTLTGRLPAILDWLAFQQVDLRRGEGRPTTELPVIGAAPAPTDRRRRPVLVAALAGAVLATGAVVWALLPDAPDPAAGPDPLPPPPTAATTGSPALRATPSTRPTPTAASSAARPSRTPTAAPSRTPTSVAPATTAMTARYQTTATRLFGYTGQVVLDNPAGPAAKDWTLVVTLAERGTLTSANGADWRQDGQTVTFTGSPVPAGRSQTITFDVRDTDPRTKAPESCTIGDDPCAGL
ncbi:SRPBCC domain-containing protein [Micromonospora sp. NPDC050200]|uniref:SRPBCC domain-containing protein n=1 Tax=Micromonospora sp. NPDC050200 TaxID=3155664 RepID=UPI0033CADE1A